MVHGRGLGGTVDDDAVFGLLLHGLEVLDVGGHREIAALSVLKGLFDLRHDRGHVLDLHAIDALGDGGEHRAVAIDGVFLIDLILIELIRHFLLQIGADRLIVVFEGQRALVQIRIGLDPRRDGFRGQFEAFAVAVVENDFVDESGIRLIGRLLRRIDAHRHGDVLEGDGHLAVRARIGDRLVDRRDDLIRLGCAAVFALDGHEGLRVGVIGEGRSDRTVVLAHEGLRHIRVETQIIDLRGEGNVAFAQWIDGIQGGAHPAFPLGVQQVRHGFVDVDFDAEVAERCLLGIALAIGERESRVLHGVAHRGFELVGALPGDAGAGEGDAGRRLALEVRARAEETGHCGNEQDSDHRQRDDHRQLGIPRLHGRCVRDMRTRAIIVERAVEQVAVGRGLDGRNRHRGFRGRRHGSRGRHGLRLRRRENRRLGFAREGCRQRRECGRFRVGRLARG